MDQNKPEGQEEVEEDTVQESAAEPSLEEKHQAALREQEDKYLRLLAEYDNYRKRSQKEKESAWTTAKADTAKGIPARL